ncbi:hypothetical protein HRR83_001748 [Exophiala dermatitidis]|uniref:peptidylprolyl isomerase n=2 Tax=Exophiala dermatitidis TaxID=5970 RepID=H6C5E3_EXODN|nr:peptidylprolyl isomerase [Exophiala dermatitidis NIH/UT8656]KAJ4516416.1 hypothetical protein HRR73_004881 [Exophiala dermatitidis]EHY58990.1 peptidylprolyl isomerase [Exophiala dermatitidis NIH/UT8656]KAJ4526551.1 hypothetical protein HRR74_001751 [Exophiala dermatitidis]KAJ4532201.1 hypothetical protein HRR76_007198 [Exophiala dermatitidis]KAJ4546237.1 hypothetical protein HRR77_004771 [Exophiala dermatitidis]
MASQFEKRLLSEGNNVDYPQVGDEVTIEYTGWLYDASKPDFKGTQFDSSVGRGDFKTQIGVGRVIPGWDTGVPQMSLGEKSRLIIPGNMAYGERGFPGLIPKNATLVFDVHLKGINNKKI